MTTVEPRRLYKKLKSIENGRLFLEHSYTSGKSQAKQSINQHVHLPAPCLHLLYSLANDQKLATRNVQAEQETNSGSPTLINHI